MPSKKKKYNARFPAGRIKRIMQSDEEVGKVAQAVPIIISRTLELFVESLLTKTLKITNSRNAKTLSTSHMKQCIMSEQRFDFLRELVRNIPDISVAEEAANYNEEDNQSSPEEQYPDSDTPYDLSMPSTSVRAVRQQQQLQIASNGHNSNNNGEGAQYDYQRSHLKRSISSNPSSSVIRHTTAAISQINATDCLPGKLARSDSTPVPQYHHHMSSIPTAVQHQQHATQHPRLRHQSYSMPTTTINDNNCNKPNIESPPTQQLRLSAQPTAIPAPIVSIDYCNKPVVKIDYSNIPITDMTNSAPASAPANIASMSDKNSNTAFNFSTEPVINIDLSNMVNVAPVASSLNSVAATINIGTPPPPAAATAASATTTNNNKIKATANAIVDQQSRNSKVTMAEPLSSSSPSSTASSSSSTTLTAKANALAAAAAATTTMTTAKTNSSSASYLEMDEDYDNI